MFSKCVSIIVNGFQFFNLFFKIVFKRFSKKAKGGLAYTNKCPMAVPRHYFSIKISTVRERLERPQPHTAVLNLVPEGHNESTYSCLHSLNLVLLNSNLVVLSG